MRKYLNVSNILFFGSVLFSIGVLLKIYIDRSSLPEGVCPADYNNGWVYLAIGLLVASTIYSSVIDYRKKKAAKETIEK